MFWASGIPKLDASEIPTCWLPDLEPPIGLGGMREALAIRRGSAQQERLACETMFLRIFTRHIPQFILRMYPQARVLSLRNSNMRFFYSHSTFFFKTYVFLKPSIYDGKRRHLLPPLAVMRRCERRKCYFSSHSSNY